MQAKIRNAACLSEVQKDEALHGQGSSSRGRGRGGRKRGRGRGPSSGRGSKEVVDQDLDAEDDQATNDVLLEGNETDKPMKQGKLLKKKPSVQAKTTEEDEPKKQAKAKTTEENEPKKQAKAKAKGPAKKKPSAAPAEVTGPTTLEQDCPSLIPEQIIYNRIDASAPVQECNKVSSLSGLSAYQKDQD